MKAKKPINVEVGGQVKRARERRGLTREQFAERIDQTPQFVSDLERGVSGISLETLRLICETLCVSSDSLLFPHRQETDAAQISFVFQTMTPEQLRMAEEIADSLLHSVQTLLQVRADEQAPKNGAP